jgi:hypothetical protein
MGKCPSCGRKKIFLEKVTCSACGKVGCVECFTFLFHIYRKNFSLETTCYSCSDRCFEKIASQIENEIDPKEIIPDSNMPPIHFLVGRSCLKSYTPQVSAVAIRQNMNILKKTYYFISFLKNSDSTDQSESILWTRLAKYTRLIQAKHFETLREFDNAAEIYKSLGMYEEAGRIRAKRNELIVKKTDISINLNALLQQVKDGGIVAIYRCPYCSGKLKVGSKTTLNSLRTCEHCGSEIEAVDLADFLKSALS